MKNAPYTLAEARQLAAEYQYLIGNTFDPTRSADIVDCVAVAPFDQTNKSRFIIYYLLFEDAEMALTNEYKGLLYDVIVIAGSAEKRELRHEDIHTWLLKNRHRNEPMVAMAQNQLGLAAR